MFKFFQTRAHMRRELMNAEIVAAGHRGRADEYQEDLNALKASTNAVIAQQRDALEQMARTLDLAGLPMPDWVRERYVKIKLMRTAYQAGIASIATPTKVLPKDELSN